MYGVQVEMKVDRKKCHRKQIQSIKVFIFVTFLMKILLQTRVASQVRTLQCGPNFLFYKASQWKSVERQRSNERLEDSRYESD